MAQVRVVSDDGRTTVEIGQDGGGRTVGACDDCGEQVTDRGYFEDTVRAAENHVDQRH